MADIAERELVKPGKFIMYSVIACIVGTVVLTVIAFFIPNVSLLAGEEFKWWIATLFVGSVYTIASWRFWDPIQPDQNAALVLLGRPVSNSGPGAPFAPLGLVQVVKVNANVLQREFPAEPENIFRGEMKSEEKLPEGMKPPVRVQFRDSITEADARKLFGPDFTVKDPEGNDISFVADVPDDGLSQRVTAEPYPVVRIAIDNPAQYLRTIGSEEEAFKQLEDELFNVITNFYTRMSVAQALANLRWMGVHLFIAAERRVGARGDEIRPWGVSIQAAFIKVIHTSKGINVAISERAQAPFQKQATIVTAEGEREKRIKEGEGAAQAARDLEQLTLIGRAEGYKVIGKATRTESGATAQSAETARALGAAGNTIVVGTDGVKELIGIAKAATEKKGG
jgi:hypothetical protein